MKLLLGIVGSTLMLCQCTNLLPGRADGIDPNPFNLLETQATTENRDPSRIKVPVLRSPALENRWGKPRLLVGPQGGYALRYEDPADKNRQLTVFGSPQKYQTSGLIPPPYTDLGRDPELRTYAPVEVSQGWQSIEVVGKKIRFYISEGSSGEQPIQYSTETFRLTAPDGRTASYRIRSASVSPVKGNSVEDLMRTVSF